MKKNLAFLLAGALILAVFSCSNDIENPAKQKVTSLTEIVLSGESSIFSIAKEQYRQDTVSLPIGVFDSGIGGLTVLSEIMTIDRFNNKTHGSGPDGIPDFDNERFLYLGDQANMPYGNYPSEDKTDFLRELILKDAVFLLGSRYWPDGQSSAPRFDKPPVKAIVIACNTATAYGLDSIREALEYWQLPVFVVGVVEAGAKGAVEALAEQQEDGAIAVMATVGTCNSEGYVRAVKLSAGQAGIDTPAVIQQGCLGLAGAIEGDRSYITAAGDGNESDYKGPSTIHETASIDTALIPSYRFDMDGILGDKKEPSTWRLNSVDNYIRYHTTTLAEKHRLSELGKPISAVILGCTHFPFRSDSIAAAFEQLRTFQGADGSEPYRDIIAGKLRFIDPSALTAVQLYESLITSDLLLEGGEQAVIEVDEFYISVPNPSPEQAGVIEDNKFLYDYKYGRNTGRFDMEYVKRVPMSGQNLSLAVMESIRETMPVVWERLVLFNAESPRCKK